MVRKLSLAVALALGVTPFAASALGLGEIESTSALNQQFNANIKLLSLKDEELEDIRVSIASAEVFEKTGIDRPHFLTRLTFKPVRLADGTGLIQVNSKDPIREPFLNFVVEVNWPNGRLFREYTVLLDPPVTISRAPAPVKAAKIASKPKPRQQVMTTSPVTTMAPATQEVGPGEYGPIRRNETLWGIAQQLRPTGATIEQTLMALFRANPHAFIASNINNLKVGEILRVPGRNDVMSLAPQAARVAFRDQLENWRKPTELAAESSPEESPSSMETTEQAPEEGAETRDTLPGAELKIAGVQQEAVVSETAEGDITAVNDQLQQDLIVAREVRESALAEGQELKSRIQSLESQLEDLQRLLELKDDQLARLQETLAGGVVADADGPVEAAGGQPEESLPAAVPGEQVAVTGAAENIAENIEEPAAEIGEVTDKDQALVDGEQDSVTAAENDQIVAAESELAELEELEVELATQEAVVVPAAPLGSEPEISEVESESRIAEATPADLAPTGVAVTPEPPRAEPSQVMPEKQAQLPQTGPMAWWNKLTGDTTLLGVAGGGVLLLLALLWMLISRRKSSNEEFQESILVDTIQDTDEGGPAEVAEAKKVGGQSEETSFLSDFSPSDIDVLQDETGEVDPISEADVYIAYGRYGQAEELIRQALERDPQRVELKRKLFDILYATKNKAAFTSLAEEAVLAKMPQTDTVGWKSVVAMGAELVPDNKLFAPATAADPVEPAAEEGGLDQDLADLGDIDLGDLTDDLELDEELQRSLDDAGEIDLQDLGLEDQGPADLDLDLDTLAGSKDAQDSVDKVGLNLDDVEFESADDALQKRENEAVGTPESNEIESYSLSDLDTDLDETVIDFSTAQSGTQSQTRPGDVLSMPDRAGDEERLELPDMDGEQGGLLSGLPDPDGFSADEVNTKLDLAKAYVEMGDAEGARGILDEVLNEGSVKQKQLAQQMLENIA